MLLQSLVALGRWVLAFIEGAAGFHQEWLEIMIPPLIHQSLCKRPNSLLLVGKKKIFFFLVVSWFCPPNCETQGLASPYPMLPRHNGAERGGVSLEAPALPPLSFKI